MTAKKPRSDSPLRMLREEAQAEVMEWLKALPQREVCAKVKAAHGFRPSPAALSGFFSWYQLRDQLVRNEATASALVESMSQSNPDLSPERLEEIGQTFFTALALESRDVKAWESTQRIGLGRAQLKLDTEKFRRDTCELFLKWAADRRANEISSSGATHSDKIAKLGELMFGEDWQR